MVVPVLLLRLLSGVGVRRYSALLDGVTLFDQHLVDTLTFVKNYDDGFLLEHTDGAQLPAFDVSASGSNVAAAIPSVDVTIGDFTLVGLDCSYSRPIATTGSMKMNTATSVASTVSS